MFEFNINALALILPPNDTVTIDVVCSATVFLFWDMLLNIDSEVGAPRRLLFTIPLTQSEQVKYIWWYICAQASTL